jgi:hypothetical protein
MNLTHLKLLGQAARHSESVEGSKLFVGSVGLGSSLSDRNMVWMTRETVFAEGENDLGSDLVHDGKDVPNNGAGISLVEMSVLVLQDARRLKP